MLRKNTITLLRLPFSYFLLPVFLFSLGQVENIHYPRAVLVFFLLHFLIYPASNGYNSYMDRDEESIGMLEKPPPPSPDLFYLTAVMDLAAILLGLLLGYVFTIFIVANILASRAYSYRGIRLKKYPFTGFLTVVIFQGAITYYMVYLGASVEASAVPWTGMVASSLLFGGSYPLTQLYQHRQDLRDGVRTISYVLGVNGTFIFSGIMYALAEGALYIQFRASGHLSGFLVLQIFLLPVAIYFLRWWKKVRENRLNANFRNTMRMNWIAATCTNAGFLLLYFINHIF